MGEHEVRSDLTLERLHVVHDVEQVERVETVVRQVELVGLGAEDPCSSDELGPELGNGLARARVSFKAGADAFPEDQHMCLDPAIRELRERRPGEQHLVVGVGGDAKRPLHVRQADHAPTVSLGPGMGHGYVFIGGVDVSEACLRALCEAGTLPALALGYTERRSGASGFRDLGPLAAEFAFDLVRTDDVNEPDLVARVARLQPQVIFVIGWSQLVKRELLTVPPGDCVGIHPTDLPLGRGRAPIPWTILKQLDRTASTMFFLTEGVDDGDIIGKVAIDLDPRETATSLYAKHRAAHVELVRTHAAALLAGHAARQPQDHSQATYWEARRPEDGRIDPTLGVAEVDRLVRAVTHPFPGAFLDGQVPGSRLIVWAGETVPSTGASPGEIVRSDRGLVLQCADAGLLLTDVEERASLS